MNGNQNFLLFSFIFFTISGINGASSVCVSEFNFLSVKIIFILLIGFSTFFSSLFCYLHSYLSKRKYNTIIFALVFSSLIISLVQFIHIFIHFLNGYIIILLSISSFIGSFIFVKMRDDERFRDSLCIIDQCSQEPTKQSDILDQAFQSERKFISFLRISVESWNPYIASFSLLEYGINKYPNNFSIHLFYLRLLAIFPARNSRMIQIGYIFSGNRKFPSRETYINQINYISHSRISKSTTRIENLLSDIHSKYEHLNLLMKRFWQNAVEQSTHTFWDDIHKISVQIDDLDFSFIELHDSYPCNITVLNEYISFATNILCDFALVRELKNQFQDFQKNGKSSIDLLKLLLQLFIQILIAFFSKY
jgi:hypothetical protein